MIKLVSTRQLKGLTTSVVILLALSSVSLAVTWDYEDAVDFELANQYTGGQLAVAEVDFLPAGESETLTLLVAITNGSDGVKLYSFNTYGGNLTFEDEVNVTVTGIENPIAWTPTFMDLDVVGTGEESCLVIPTLSDGTHPGSISIVRLTERDISGNLEIEHNCFNCDADTHGSVYYVAELPPDAAEDYAISTEFPGDHVENVILLSSYDYHTKKFDDEITFTVPYIYYGSHHLSIDTRTWVTAFQDFFYGSASTLCYTTTHNGGVLVWDPREDVNNRIVSRIGVSQCGGWDYQVGSISIGGELGDVHRAVVLEGASDTFSDLGDIQVASRLLFYSNNTMGLMISDISKPDAPQHIFQWDGDTRPREETSEDEDWDWHGAGDMDDDTIVQADAGEYAARTFGIGVATAIPEESLPIIHVYLAGGIDGLYRFDFSDFLNPFGVEAYGETNFDDFSIDTYDSYVVNNYPMQAFDLQTFSEDGDTWVFTSWRMSAQYHVEGPIGLTAHLDEDVECD